MGAKATKLDGTYLPDTPTLNKLRIVSREKDVTGISTGEMEPKDPRSPSGCRTPLNFLLPPQQPQPVALVGRSETAFSQLRKRLLKGFALNDPRSPQLNRTPLVFDEAIDRTLNMDDTFADLFVDTRAPSASSSNSNMISANGEAKNEVEMELRNLSTSSEVFSTPLSHNNSSLEIASMTCDEDAAEEAAERAPQPQLPPQQIYDPRSPSIGVDRTPIIFCDDGEDEEEREAKMLEQVLETLTLNLSNESSMASFVSAAAELTLDEPQPQQRPANKHLERVRLGNKQRVPPRKPARASKSQTPQRIYVDSEAATSTPKSITNNATGSGKRTPLSCVKNRPHLRSRSVEKDMRKTRLPLQSFDDQLNPSECLNVPSLRILMANCEDSLNGSIY
ncbi:rab effector MyRIP [Scaptodrosophila lebanonensis]|uniref:Rab effector MyRIP n=1 Tax=Drosophila lebanonensis TaxID=7225 RepID=A0A6J2TPH2_DROLE|nr:rab effector MyRIP [Scaptodrosophila lebanonensis]